VTLHFDRKPYLLLPIIPERRKPVLRTKVTETILGWLDSALAQNRK